MGLKTNRMNTFQAYCGHYIPLDKRYVHLDNKAYCLHCDPRLIRVRTKTGIIKRVPRIVQCGNFMQMYVRYNHKDYLVGDGDEYLHGMPKVFALGKAY